ncbi:MAG: hypothetical protein Q4C67_07900 [Deinococcus sp.]|nr:hypothetical protein [Deinococcus sp.]
MSVNSREKGKRGELEFAQALTKRGHPARRGQQFAGGGDSPDVVCESLPGIHWEVKRTQACALPHAAEVLHWEAQAQRDAAPNRLPAIAHRWDGCRTWFVRPLHPDGTRYWQTLDEFLSDHTNRKESQI